MNSLALDHDPDFPPVVEEGEEEGGLSSLAPALPRVFGELNTLQLGVEGGQVGICDAEGHLLAPLDGVTWDGSEDSLRHLVALQEDFRLAWTRTEAAVAEASPFRTSSGGGRLGGQMVAAALLGLLFGALPLFVPLLTVWMLAGLACLVASLLLDLKPGLLIEDARRMAERDGEGVVSPGAPAWKVERAATRASIARVPLSRLALGLSVLTLVFAPLGLEPLVRLGASVALASAGMAFALSVRARRWWEAVRDAGPGAVRAPRAEEVLRLMAGAPRVSFGPEALYLRTTLCLVGEVAESGDACAISPLRPALAIAVGGEYLIPEGGALWFEAPERVAEYALREVLLAGTTPRPLLQEAEVNLILREI